MPVTCREDGKTLVLVHRFSECALPALLFGIVSLLIVVGKGIAFLSGPSFWTGAVCIIGLFFVVFTLVTFYRCLRIRPWRRSIYITREKIAFRECDGQHEEFQWSDVVAVDPQDKILVFKDGRRRHLVHPELSSRSTIEGMDKILEIIPDSCIYAKAVREYQEAGPRTRTILLLGFPIVVAAFLDRIVQWIVLALAVLLVFVVYAQWYKEQKRIRKKWLCMQTKTSEGTSGTNGERRDKPAGW